jgi:hypothetical protein
MNAEKVSITGLDDLKPLWLPWCVERKHPHRFIRIDHEPERRHEARQLRVQDLAEPAVREALSAYPREDGRSVMQAINAFASLFAGGPGKIVLSEAEAFRLAEGLMLHESCHRACALFEGGVDEFELHPLIHPVFDGWSVYEQHSLRTS